MHGLNILLGRYHEVSGRLSGGYSVFEKAVENGASACFLYYCRPAEHGDDAGWWFGDEVDGNEVYGHAPNADMKYVFPPPATGRVVPIEARPKLSCLRVEYVVAAAKSPAPLQDGGASSPNDPLPKTFLITENQEKLGMRLSDSWPLHGVINSINGPLQRKIWLHCLKS